MQIITSNDAAALLKDGMTVAASAFGGCCHPEAISAAVEQRFLAEGGPRGLTLLFAASGARSLFTSGALQRQFRDAHAVNSHLAFNFDAAGTNYGRVALGLPSENLTL